MIKLKTEKLYSRIEFAEFLKEQGLPFSKPTIIKYEKNGVIPEQRKVGGARVYTATEIIENVNTIRRHKND